MSVLEAGEDLIAAEAVDEGEDAAQMAVEGDLARDEPLEVGVGCGSEGREAMDEGPALAPAFGVEERLDVGGVDDVVSATVVAGVSGDLVGAEVDGDVRGGGLQGEGAPDEGGRDAVEVGVERDAAEGAGAHGADDAGVVGRVGLGGEKGAFFGEQVDGSTQGGAVLADVGDLLEPGLHGGVGVGEGGEGAAGEEALLEVLGGVLDAALLVGAVGCAGDGPEAVMGGEVEEPGVESDVGADVGEDDAAEVVVEDAPWDAAGGGEGPLVAGEEDLELFAERELDVESAAVAQDVEEGGEASGTSLDEEGAAGGPVDLGGVAGREGDADERRRTGRGSDGADERLEHGVAAEVAEGACLGVETHGGEVGVSEQERTQGVLEGVELGPA